MLFGSKFGRESDLDNLLDKPLLIEYYHCKSHFSFISQIINEVQVVRVVR